MGLTAVLAALQWQYWWAIGIFLAAASMFPHRRKEILLVATACWVFLVPPVNGALLEELAATQRAAHWVPYWPVMLPAVWLFVAGYLWWIRKFPFSPPGRRPVTGLIISLLGVFALSQVVTGAALVFVATAAMIFSRYIWFFAYWISENSAAQKNAQPGRRTFAWRPLWGFTNVPFGKGASYLERVEAKDDEQLAKAQLAGVKLLALGVVFMVIAIALNRGLYGPTASLTTVPKLAPQAWIPPYLMALDAMIAGTPYPIWIRWAALVLDFVLWALYFTAFGHVVIAICRVAGFNVFRNTYKPVFATSIAEFYNRVYYYFKELLVTFFFYPTYLRYFKKHPRLRAFAATVMSAGFGNFLFHYLRDDGSLLRTGLWETLILYRSYAVYAAILSVAIGISQLRANAGRRTTSRWRNGRAMAGVLLFYCFISIIQEPESGYTLSHFGMYFVSLFRP